MAVTAEDSFYILRFDRDAYNAKLEEGADIGDEGVEEAFDVIAEVPEKYAPFLFFSIALSEKASTVYAPQSGLVTASSTPTRPTV